MRLVFLHIVERTAKFAASTKAHARYLFPFLVLPSPFFLPLER